RLAWMSLVLVAGEHRRRGLGTMMLRRAMADLTAAKFVPVLDATPDGRAVYRKLGFEDSWGFARLIRHERQRAAASVGALAGVTVRPIADADWPALCAYAAAPFGPHPATLLPGLPAPHAARSPPACAGGSPRPAPSPRARTLSPASCSAATAAWLRTSAR